MENVQTAQTETPIEASVIAPDTQIAEQNVQKQDPERFGSRFAALTKREKQAIERERSVKELEERINTDKAKFQPAIEAFSRAKEDPIGLLKAAGIDLDYVIRSTLNDGKVAPEDKIEQVKQELMSKIEETDKKLKEKEENEIKLEQQAIEARMANIAQMVNSDVVDHIKKNPEKYELILAYDAIDQVLSEQWDYFRQKEKFLPPEVICEKIEEDILKGLEKIEATKKFSSKFQKVPTKTPEPIKTNQAPKTLTNNLTISTPKQSGYLTREERMKAAAAKLIVRE